MTALDTNVLVRFLVEDDEAQSARAAALVRRAAERDEALFVSDIVVGEMVWVLDSAYGFSRDRIAAVLGKLLSAKQLAFRDSDVLSRALSGFAAGHGGFADYVIREHAREAGCDEVATFDKGLLREPGFVRP